MIQRMDNVLIVVEDLEAAKAFFAELGMELEGETTVEGPWVDQTVGLNDVRADITMMRTPDGHGRVELSRFHRPPAVRAEPENAPANALGMRRIMFMVDDVDDVVTRLRSHGANSWARSRSTRTSTGSASCVAPKASSSGCPSSSAEAPWVRPGQPHCAIRRRSRKERLMGFEPTTFCMASRRSSQLSYSRASGEYS